MLLFSQYGVKVSIMQLLIIFCIPVCNSRNVYCNVLCSDVYNHEHEQQVHNVITINNRTVNFCVFVNSDWICINSWISLNVYNYGDRSFFKCVTQLSGVYYCFQWNIFFLRVIVFPWRMTIGHVCQSWNCDSSWKMKGNDRFSKQDSGMSHKPIITCRCHF